MANGKKTFIFYSDWINMVREMPNEDAGELLKHILSYVNDENPETKNLLVKMAFGHMKPMLKMDLDKWEKQLEKYSEMGKASAEKRKKQHKSTQVEHRLTQVKPKNTVNENVNVNDNINENKKKSIEERKSEFKNSLFPFKNQYDIKLLEKFYFYWTEHGENDRKFRKEKQKSFNISLRLKTWKENDEKFKQKNNSKEKGVAESIMDANSGARKLLGLD